MHEDMEENLDMNQILHAKSAKGGNPSPVIQGKCFRKRLDKFFTWESMIADKGCLSHICTEQIAKDLRLKIFPFKREMSIIDASGNLLSLLGSAYLFVKTQVLGRNKIKKLEVAVLKGSNSDREILLSLKTLIDWNLVHPDFPNVQLDSFIQKMVNKHMGKKAYSTLYL